MPPNRRSIKDAVGDPCHYCSRIMIAPPKDIQKVDVHTRGLVCTEEHIRPRYFGGDDSEANIEFACSRCNSLRGHVNYNVFMMFAKQIIIHYPDVPNMYLRMGLQIFISCLAEIAVSNRKHAKKAVGQVISAITLELKKVR